MVMYITDSTSSTSAQSEPAEANVGAPVALPLWQNIHVTKSAAPMVTYITDKGPKLVHDADRPDGPTEDPG